ncbi:glucose-1-phosphate cytidylyltransferase [Puniceicoccaceae bacterium K14]|nr:glucose-1-phosphate cytidylyltransferase [Puniceicoccaceae bacterium K14]
MKAVILAGGFGTRISEESSVKPKPMIEVGTKPILWHIMKMYAHHGITEFIICCGYKGHIIKQYFANYYLNRSDITFDLKNQDIQIHNNASEPWKVTCADTGESTMTGGRIRRAAKYIGDETFCLTYGDGVSNVNITELVAHHKRQQSLATLTAVQPPGRFGAFTLDEGNSKVSSFSEKPAGDGAWINGGFFVVEPEAIDYIDDDDTVWEKDPLERISNEGKLSAFRHSGFWQPMDTLRDKMLLEELWKNGDAPWKIDK